MTHPSVEEVALHLEGMLDPADERRVRAHLEDCPECTATARDLRGVTGHLQAAPLPAIPDAVAARVESALAQEAAKRGAGTDASAVQVAAEGTAPRQAVGDLAARRRRRRRVVSGGLLAAAAATVVAVGLGQLMQGGSDGAAGSAQLSAESRPGPQRGSAGRGPQASALDEGDQSHAAPPKPRGPQAFRGNRLPGLTDRVLGPRAAGLIEGVAAAHSPNQAPHQLAGCVRAALGGDLGPVASYAVPLPGQAGVRGVVVLRPNRTPTEGVLIACTSQPQVLARRGLRP